jgi:eukaryotic-like serine/threonine-protein kinase
MKLKEFFKSYPVFANILLALMVVVFLSVFSLQILKLYTHHGQSITVPELVGESLEEAINEINQKHLRFGVIDSAFVLDLEPGTVLDQYPKANDKVKQGRRIFLTIASETPEQVAVPKLTDVSIREAQSRLENIGLQIGHLTYRPSEFFDLVLDQRFEGSFITPGTLLPKGSKVDLVVGRGLSSEQTNIPDLTGLTLSIARSFVDNLNLNIGAIIYDQTIITSIDSMKARIWKQYPDLTNSSTVGLGTSIDLWLTTDETKLFPQPEEEQYSDD